MATNASGLSGTSAYSRLARSRSRSAIVAVTSTARNSVTCGAVKALATTAAAVALRTPRTGSRRVRGARRSGVAAVRTSSRVMTPPGPGTVDGAQVDAEVAGELADGGLGEGHGRRRGFRECSMVALLHSYRSKATMLTFRWPPAGRREPRPEPVRHRAVAAWRPPPAAGRSPPASRSVRPGPPRPSGLRRHRPRRPRPKPSRPRRSGSRPAPSAPAPPAAPPPSRRTATAAPPPPSPSPPPPARRSPPRRRPAPPARRRPRPRSAPRPRPAAGTPRSHHATARSTASSTRSRSGR